MFGSTYCGARVNYRFEVLDKNHEPIPGLDAAGLTSSGMNKVNTYFPRLGAFVINYAFSMQNKKK